MMNKGQFIAYLAPQFGDSKKEAARAVEVVFDRLFAISQRATM
jgi:DNA-binding protein HU-beta